MDNQTAIEKVLNHGFKLGEGCPNFFSLSDKIPLVCKEGHSFVTAPRFFLDKRKQGADSKGCPICENIILTKKSIEKAESRLVGTNLKIFSVFHKKSNKVGENWALYYNIICNDGHIFERNVSELTGGATCPRCTSKIFLGQERTRQIMQVCFNAPFFSVRPDFLKNPKSNKNLELDGYNEKLQMAFEFQGKQHEDNDTQFGGGLIEQQERDALKKELCEKNGVKLFLINQPKKYDKKAFTYSVLCDLKEQGYNFINDKYLELINME